MFLPVIFPGFSWFSPRAGPQNQIPRDGGIALTAQATGITLRFPEFAGRDTLELSVNGGATWPISMGDAAGSLLIALPPGTFEVMVGHGAVQPEVRMGEVRLS